MGVLNATYVVDAVLNVSGNYEFTYRDFNVTLSFSRYSLKIRNRNWMSVKYYYLSFKPF